MNKQELTERHVSIRESARKVTSTLFLGASALSGGAAGGLLGFKAGDTVAPQDTDSLAGNILERGIEVSSAGMLGAIGIMIGLGVAVWALDNDFDTI